MAFGVVDSVPTTVRSGAITATQLREKTPPAQTVIPNMRTPNGVRFGPGADPTAGLTTVSSTTGMASRPPVNALQYVSGDPRVMGRYPGMNNAGSQAQVRFQERGDLDIPRATQVSPTFRTNLGMAPALGGARGVHGLEGLAAITAVNSEKWLGLFTARGGNVGAIAERVVAEETTRIETAKAEAAAQAAAAEEARLANIAEEARSTFMELFKAVVGQTGWRDQQVLDAIQRVFGGIPESAVVEMTNRGLSGLASIPSLTWQSKASAALTARGGLKGLAEAIAAGAEVPTSSGSSNSTTYLVLGGLVLAYLLFK